MSLKMMKKTFVVSAFVACGALAAIGCGDSKDKDDDGNGGEEDAGGGGSDTDAGTGGGVPAGAKRSWGGTLVSILAQDTNAPIKDPHKIIVLGDDGEPLEGGKYTTTTSTSDGSWSLKDVPMEKPIGFWVQGFGDDKTGTYDSVIINVKYTSADDPLTRISSASTASIAGSSAGFTAMADKSAMSGAVYLVKDGKRIGVVGCTQVYLDDDNSQPQSKGDLRYVGSNGLPVPVATQSKTEGTRGAFLFANIDKGKHKIKFSVDGGKTFFGETEFTIGKARQDAASAYKGILYQIGVEVTEDKTPADCK